MLAIGEGSPGSGGRSMMAGVLGQVAIAALYGPDGVGKTSLASAEAERHRHGFGTTKAGRVACCTE